MATGKFLIKAKFWPDWCAPVTNGQCRWLCWNSLVLDVEKELKNSMEREVPAMRIGDMVMERLRAVDDVAYVRFASVYRKFEDVETFIQEIHKMMEAAPKE